MLGTNSKFFKAELKKKRFFVIFRNEIVSNQKNIYGKITTPFFIYKQPVAFANLSLARDLFRLNGLNEYFQFSLQCIFKRFKPTLNSFQSALPPLW